MTDKDKTTNTDSPLYCAADIEALVGRGRATLRSWEEQGLVKLRRDSRGNLIATEAEVAQLKKLAALRDARHGKTGRRRLVIATSTYMG
jgi:hypothetical protein